MLIIKGLRLTAFNYAVYLVLAVMGYIAWRRSAREQLASVPA
jgi:nicotinamide riboside transporter PnuC